MGRKEKKEEKGSVSLCGGGEEECALPFCLYVPAKVRAGQFLKL